MAEGLRPWHELGRGASAVAGLAVVPTGLAALDRLLPHGGLPLGRLIEVEGGRSSGKRALVTAICDRLLQRRRRVAWIDGSGRFYPLPALEHHAGLDRLLVVRLGQAATRAPVAAVLKAADLLLQASSALTLLVIDPPPGGTARPRPQAQLARLRLAAERGGTTVLFIHEQDAASLALGSLGGLGSFGCLRLRVDDQGEQGLRVVIVKSKLGQMARQAHLRSVQGAQGAQGVRSAQSNEGQSDGSHGMFVDRTV